MPDAILQVRNVVKRFGGIIAVNKISFDVREGEILGLIGPNGAGKTTLFNCITGIYVPEEGRVYFKGEDITKVPTHKRVERGIAMVPELLLLDEPSLGLAPKIVLEVFDVIKKLKEEGVTILIVEQHVKNSLETADRAYVMEIGRIVLEGEARSLLKDERLKKAYLVI